MHAGHRVDSAALQGQRLLHGRWRQGLSSSAGVQSPQRLERVLRSGLQRTLPGKTRPWRECEELHVARRLSAQRHCRSESARPTATECQGVRLGAAGQTG